MKLKTARPVAKLRQGRTDWYRIVRNQASGTAEIAIYDEIGYFGVTAGDFLTELKALDVTRIDVRINSPGGDVWDGLAIYNSLRDHPAEVTTYVDGLAASAASIIVQAGARRIAAKASEVMIHEAWGLVVGNAVDMRDAADRLDQASGMIAGVYADRAGGTVDSWREAMRAESWYTGTEAADAGLVDEVAGTAAGGDQANSWDLSIYSYAGREQAPAPPLPAAEPDELVFDAEAFRLAMEEVGNASRVHSH
jgi:ATP-dependent Clp endopeptidase proteolytic subunit ClpP